MKRAAAAVFALAFFMGLLGFAVLFWTRDTSYYELFASEAGLLRTAVLFAADGPADHPVLATDRQLRAFMLCGCPDALFAATPITFNEREVSHLRDVAAIYRVLQPLTAFAALAMLSGVRLSRRALRDVALVEAALVVAAGVVAALAFEPAFSLFHHVFFPQGNFLFDPATDNLVRLYPEAYWLGVTLRVGGTFVVGALLVAALVSIPIGFRAKARTGV